MGAGARLRQNLAEPTGIVDSGLEPLLASPQDSSPNVYRQSLLFTSRWLCNGVGAYNTCADPVLQLATDTVLDPVSRSVFIHLHYFPAATIVECLAWLATKMLATPGGC